MRTKAEALAALKADQQFWRDLAAEVGPGRYAEPGPMGDWTFGDMAGHLLGWRNRTISRVDALGRGEAEPAPPWPAGLGDDDAIINDWIREQDSGRLPDELVAAYDRSYDRLAAAIEAVPDDRLTDPDAFPWLEGPLVDADFTGHLHDDMSRTSAPGSTGRSPCGSRSRRTSGPACGGVATVRSRGGARPR